MNKIDNYNKDERNMNATEQFSGEFDNYIDLTAEKQMAEASKSLMTKVYGWMCGALGITALTALFCAGSPWIMQIVFENPIVYWGTIILEFALVVGVTAMIERLSLRTATLLFVLYSIVNGITMSIIFYLYSMATIATTFFVTAGMFGAMAVYGTVTKKDLSGWGTYLFMALIGLILAGVVNYFVGNTVLDFIISVAGVVIFVGLTAFDAQKIKRLLANAVEVNEGYQKVALLGSLSLYLDFINMFLYLLRLFGRSK